MDRKHWIWNKTNGQDELSIQVKNKNNRINAVINEDPSYRNQTRRIRPRSRLCRHICISRECNPRHCRWTHQNRKHWLADEWAELDLHMINRMSGN